MVKITASCKRDAERALILQYLRPLLKGGAKIKTIRDKFIKVYITVPDELIQRELRTFDTYNAFKALCTNTDNAQE